jgi:hypothetical protein
MARKEITKEQADKFIAAYAKKHEVSEAKAKEMILHTGISRLTALEKAAKKKNGLNGSNGKSRHKKAAKTVKAAKKAPKAVNKAPRKPKAVIMAEAEAVPLEVSEGEE